MNEWRNVRVLSVRQPWAWAIVNGLKLIENRSRRTWYRGELWIHASRGYTNNAEWERCRELSDERLPERDKLSIGVILGKVELVDCVRYDDLPIELRKWAEPGWCYVLRDAMNGVEIPHVGYLGIHFARIKV